LFDEELALMEPKENVQVWDRTDDRITALLDLHGDKARFRWIDEPVEAYR
jgi:hypothetical protein